MTRRPTGAGASKADRASGTSSGRIRRRNRIIANTSSIENIEPVRITVAAVRRGRLDRRRRTGCSEPVSPDLVRPR